MDCAPCSPVATPGGRGQQEVVAERRAKGRLGSPVSHPEHGDTLGRCFPRDPTGDSTVMRPGQSERSDAGVALLRGGGWVGQRPGPAFAQRLAFEGDAVGVVDQAIEDGIGEGGVADDVVPVLDR